MLHLVNYVIKIMNKPSFGLGLMLSALLDSEVFAIQVAFGVYIPVVIVGGTCVCEIHQ